MPDLRTPASSAARWVIPSVLLSIAVIAALQLSVERWPDLRTLFGLVPPVLSLGLLLLVYGNWIARDRLAFVSVAAPALVLATAAVFVRWPWSGVFFWAALGLILGVAWWAPMTGWWTVHVLRRPPLTPRRRFRGGLASDLWAWHNAFRGAGPGPLTDRRRRRAAGAIASMRAREAPDGTLGELRDEIVDVADRWMALPRDEAHAQAFVDLQEELTRLQARLPATSDED
jgi:septum formation topological specificity factor MinE